MFYDASTNVMNYYDANKVYKAQTKDLIIQYLALNPNQTIDQIQKAFEDDLHEEIIRTAILNLGARGYIKADEQWRWSIGRTEIIIDH